MKVLKEYWFKDSQASDCESNRSCPRAVTKEVVKERLWMAYERTTDEKFGKEFTSSHYEETEPDYDSEVQDPDNALQWRNVSALHADWGEQLRGLYQDNNPLPAELASSIFGDLPPDLVSLACSFARDDYEEAERKFQEDIHDLCQLEKDNYLLLSTRDRLECSAVTISMILQREGVRCERPNS